MEKEQVDSPQFDKVALESQPTQVGWHAGEDEAKKVLASHHNEQPITEEEIRVMRRKLNWRMLPILGFTYGLQSMDKGALGIAAIFGITRDLDLIRVVSVNPRVTDSGRYSLVSSIFFVGFICGAFPLAAIAQRFPIGRVCAVYCLLWGIVCLLTVACTSYEGIMAQRFFLGFIESGVSPSFITVVSSWYTQPEQAMMSSWFYACTGLCTIPFYFIWYGIARGVQSNSSNPSAIPSAWKEIYYFCGGLTILWAAVIWFFLPDSPVNASFLTERERYVAVERMRAGQGGVRNKTLKWKQAASTFKDFRLYLIWAAMYFIFHPFESFTYWLSDYSHYISFCITTPVGILTNFSAIVVRDIIGKDAWGSVALSTPGAAVLAVFALGGGYIAMKVPNTRTIIYVVSASICCMACGLLWKLPLSSASGLLAGLMLLNSFAGGYGQVLGWTASNVAGSTKKSVASAMTFIFYCLGNIAGPLFFKARQAPRYPDGFMATMICLAIGIACAATYGTLCHIENKRRDKLPPSTTDNAFEDLTDLENMDFRYRV